MRVEMDRSQSPSFAVVMITAMLLYATQLDSVAATCSEPRNDAYAQCMVSECYANPGGCATVNPIFTFSRTGTNSATAYNPLRVAYAASQQAYAINSGLKTHDYFPDMECLFPFAKGMCPHLTDTAVASCSYALCLNNPSSGLGSCASFGASFGWSGTSPESQDVNTAPFSKTCSYPVETDPNTFITPSFTIPKALCWERDQSCSEYPTYASGTPPHGQDFVRKDEAGLGYWLGVAQSVMTEYYSCDPGFILVNQTGVFHHCESDLQNQCVKQTRPSGDTPISGPAQATYCAGHGTCAVDTALTDANRLGAVPESNNIYMSCTCSSGYTQASTGEYCAVAPCLDQWGTAQQTCVGHGTCGPATTGAPYTCLCTGGYGGEVCQWPPSTAAVVGPLGQPSQQQNIVFWYHGSTQRGFTVAALATVGADYTPAIAFYSMRFADGSSNKTLTEPTSGVTTTLTIQPKCYVAATETPVAGTDVLLALYGDSNTRATSLIIPAATQDTWVVGCLKPATGVNTDTDPCRLPFLRSGVSGSMQDICVAPLASEVATVTFDEIGKVYCMIVPTTHWLAQGVATGMSNYFCWTAYGYSAAASSSLAPTFSAFPAADKADVFCLFTDSSLLWTIMNAPNAHLEWFHVYKAMGAAGCA